MAVYGAFISAPLGHFLISILQRMFSGRTSLTAKIMQILVSNLVVRVHHPRILRFGHRGELTLSEFADRTHPEYSLPRLHGRHRRCQDFPPDQSDHQSWLHACHESQLGRLTLGIGLCPEVLA